MTRPAIVALLACLLVLPGCYRRVVAARGIGAERTAIQKPYRSNTSVDRWIDGSSGAQLSQPTLVKPELAPPPKATAK